MKEKINIYLIGIGGIGMSALARYFLLSGKNVAGYDRVRTTLCEELELEGMSIHYSDDIKLIPSEFTEPETTMVIYTPAVPENHQELNYFRKNNFQLQKRAQVLGGLAENHTCLAVAGTHGKTTTSSLLAHIFKTAGTDMAAFLGGIATNYQTNFLGNELLNAEFMVVEADEYDRSFLQLNPAGAIITSMDADHLDVYGDVLEIEKTFREFANKVRDKRVVRYGLPISGITYGVEVPADYSAQNIRISEHAYHFDLIGPSQEIKDISSGLPGRHNVENAVGAAALALEFKLPADKIREAIITFRGVKRRFEYQIKTDELVYIDDYAHHPREIEVLISSVKELYPGLKICGIFQPHLYSRTRDFADEFAQSLSQLDELILMEIYAARENAIPDVSSSLLLEKVKLSHKYLMEKEDILKHLLSRKKGVILTIGAGDIDTLVQPLKNTLEHA